MTLEMTLDEKTLPAHPLSSFQEASDLGPVGGEQR
jgi:hypothetical protein